MYRPEVDENMDSPIHTDLLRALAGTSKKKLD